MPISVEKSVVMHCGNNQPNYTDTLYGRDIPIVDCYTDLGVVGPHTSDFTAQCRAVAAKAGKTATVIRHVFNRGARELLWPAFQYYVLPTLMYCAPVWGSYLQADIQLLERVQRRYTKFISGLYNLDYDSRLRELATLSLQNRRLYAEMTRACMV